MLDAFKEPYSYSNLSSTLNPMNPRSWSVRMVWSQISGWSHREVKATCRAPSLLPLQKEGERSCTHSTKASMIQHLGHLKSYTFTPPES